MTDDQRAYAHLTIFGLSLALLGFVLLAGIVLHWHLTHPTIEAHLPNANEMQMPPDLFPVQSHDVKG